MFLQFHIIDATHYVTPNEAVEKREVLPAFPRAFSVLIIHITLS